MYTLYYITMFLMTCDEYEFVVLNSVYVSRSPSSDTLSMSIQRSHNFGLDITSFGGELAIKTCPPKLIFIQLFRKPSVFFFCISDFQGASRAKNGRSLFQLSTFTSPVISCCAGDVCHACHAAFGLATRRPSGSTTCWNV